MSSSNINSGRESDNVTAGEAAKERIERRLREAGVRIDRSVDVKAGTKGTEIQNHPHPTNQTYPGLIGGNYTVHGGDGLVILDIDVPIEDLPDWVANLPSTFVVESPHGGYHRYYTIEDDEGISNTSLPWGSVRYKGWYSLGPGSSIDHEFCDDGKENCPGHGVGEYTEIENPIAALTGEGLENLKTECNSGGKGDAVGPEYDSDQITLPDDALADEAEQYICTEFTLRDGTGDLACEEIMDFLRGGTGSYSLRCENGTNIDRSAADFYALDMLYGAFLFRGDDEPDARRYALAIFKRYCREVPHDKTGQIRKWLARGDAYLQEQMDAVQEGFDLNKWHRWRRRNHKYGYSATDQKPWVDPSQDGVPSQITRDTIHATLHILTSDLNAEYVAHQYGLDASLFSPPCGEMFTPTSGSTSRDSHQYPTAREVGEVAAEINPDRKASYFAETVKKLSRNTNRVAQAYCPSRPNGERHVYYLADLPDPEDARWVKIGGEKRQRSVQEGETEE